MVVVFEREVGSDFRRREDVPGASAISPIRLKLSSGQRSLEEQVVKAKFLEVDGGKGSFVVSQVSEGATSGVVRLQRLHRIFYYFLFHHFLRIFCFISYEM